MLMENNKLQWLYIGLNDIGDDGMRLITEGLQCNNTLTKLVAQGCGVSVEGTQIYCVTTTLIISTTYIYVAIASYLQLIVLRL